MLDDAKRWMYSGNRPNRVARFLNRGWQVVASSGVVGFWLVTLEVVGRKSGKLIRLPVVVARVDGGRYLVSMLGDEAQWVRNVRAAGGKAAIRSGRRRDVMLEEVPVAQRAPILKVYLKWAPGARAHIPVHKDAPLADFAAVAADFPAFRVVPVSA